MNKITELIWKLARPAAENNGCELWDVEYLKEAGQWYLRIYIDREPGVTLDDCEAVSRGLSDILDESDPIPESYILEVSSPGAERELKRESDFARFMGETVEVRLYKGLDGSKSYSGRLTGWSGGGVTIETESGPRTFTKEQVAKTKLKVF